MAKTPNWVGYRVQLLSKALHEGRAACIRSRWRYTRGALAFAAVTAMQYSMHDRWYLLGLNAAIVFTGLASRAWLLTRRRRQEA